MFNFLILYRFTLQPAEGLYLIKFTKVNRLLKIYADSENSRVYVQLLFNMICFSYIRSVVSFYFFGISSSVLGFFCHFPFFLCQWLLLFLILTLIKQTLILSILFMTL